MPPPGPAESCIVPASVEEPDGPVRPGATAARALTSTSGGSMSMSSSSTSAAGGWLQGGKAEGESSSKGRGHGSSHSRHFWQTAWLMASLRYLYGGDGRTRLARRRRVGLSRRRRRGDRLQLSLKGDSAEEQPH